jgi:hypothetical protein
MQTFVVCPVFVFPDFICPDFVIPDFVGSPTSEHFRGPELNCDHQVIPFSILNNGNYGLHSCKTTNMKQTTSSWILFEQFPTVLEIDASPVAMDIGDLFRLVLLCR